MKIYKIIILALLSANCIASEIEIKSETKKAELNLPCISIGKSPVSDHKYCVKIRDRAKKRHCKSRNVDCIYPIKQEKVVKNERS